MTEVFHYTLRTMTIARGSLNFALGDVKTLLRGHDALTGKNVGRPDRNLDAYNRAGIILSITAWEAFIEDTISFAFIQMIQGIHQPDELPDLLKSTVASIQSNCQKSGTRITTKEAENRLRSGNWKAVYSERIAGALKLLNTPSSVNIRKLTNLYLSVDVTTYWHWRGAKSEDACKRLDTLIHLRGGLVHRSKQLIETKSFATRKQLVNAMNLVEHLADCTEKALGLEVETIVI